MTLPEGYKVKFTHLRYFPEGGIPWTSWDAKENGLSPAEFIPNAGATICMIFDSEKNLIVESTAICGPRDHFSKKIGRNISYGRCLKMLESGDSA